jgi:hypothetical protein
LHARSPRVAALGFRPERALIDSEPPKVRSERTRNISCGEPSELSTPSASPFKRRRLNAFSLSQTKVSNHL